MSNKNNSNKNNSSNNDNKANKSSKKQEGYQYEQVQEEQGPISINAQDNNFSLDKGPQNINLDYDASKIGDSGSKEESSVNFGDLDTDARNNKKTDTSSSKLEGNKQMVAKDTGKEGVDQFSGKNEATLKMPGTQGKSEQPVKKDKETVDQEKEAEEVAKKAPKKVETPKKETPSPQKEALKKESEGGDGIDKNISIPKEENTEEGDVSSDLSKEVNSKEEINSSENPPKPKAETTKEKKREEIITNNLSDLFTSKADQEASPEPKSKEVEKDDTEKTETDPAETQEDNQVLEKTVSSETEETVESTEKNLNVENNNASVDKEKTGTLNPLEGEQEVVVEQEVEPVENAPIDEVATTDDQPENNSPEGPNTESDNFKELLDVAKQKYSKLTANLVVKNKIESSGGEIDPVEIKDIHEGVSSSFDEEVKQKQQQFKDGFDTLDPEKENLDTVIPLGGGDEAKVVQDGAVDEEDSGSDSEKVEGEEEAPESKEQEDQAVHFDGFDLAAEKAKEQATQETLKKNKLAERLKLEERAKKMQAHIQAEAQKREEKRQARKAKMDERVAEIQKRRDEIAKNLQAIKEERTQRKLEREERMIANKKQAEEEKTKVLNEAEEKKNKVIEDRDAVMANLPAIIEKNRKKVEEGTANEVELPVTIDENRKKLIEENNLVKDGKVDQERVNAFVEHQKIESELLVEKKKEEAEAIVKAAENGESPEETTETVSEENKDNEVVEGASEKSEGDTKKDPLNDIFEGVGETDEERAVAEENEKIKNKGYAQGLMVGRSAGYGAKIIINTEPPAKGEEDKPQPKYIIEDFGTTEEEAEIERVKYINEQHKKAEIMHEFWNKPDENGEVSAVKKDFIGGYWAGYNMGHSEGTNLRKEASQAKAAKEYQDLVGSDEYSVGASLGYEVGVLSAKGEQQIDTSFTYKIKEEEGEEGAEKTKEVKVTMALADLRKSVQDASKTPGGELTGSVLRDAFVQHFNSGYMEAQRQRNQPPPMDANFKEGLSVGQVLGFQQGKGEAGDQDLVERKKKHNDEVTSELSDEDRQKHHGFIAGYNQGYMQAQKQKESAVVTAQKERNNDPNFMAGYAAGNLKGFLTAIIAPSGISILDVLQDSNKAEAAGIPDYFPMSETVKGNIVNKLNDPNFAPVDESQTALEIKNATDKFHQGFTMGSSIGQITGEKKRQSFQAEKIKFHPDYQKAIKPLGLSGVSLELSEVSLKAEDMSLGHILAVTQLTLDNLNAKKELDPVEQEKQARYNATIATLRADVESESEFFQRGVKDRFDQLYKLLIKEGGSKEDEVSLEDLAGAENSIQRDGYEDGLKIGDRVVGLKEELKGLHRRGVDISERNAKLNKIIKVQRLNAEKKGKDCLEGGKNTYYRGYINGYNASLWAAKNAKKSDMGNKDVEGGFSDVEKHVKEAVLDSGELEAVTQTLATYLEEIKSLGKESTDKHKILKEAVAEVVAKDNSTAKTMFKDGAEIGYNAAYNGMKNSDKFNLNTKLIDIVRKSYDKTLKEKAKQVKSTKKEEEKHQVGLLYFFISGFQAWNDNVKGNDAKFGAPKGRNDGYSYHMGYEDGRKKALALNNLKDSDDSKGKTKPPSKDAYEGGLKAAEYTVRYEEFRSDMIGAKTEEETTSDDDLSLLKKAEKEIPKEGYDKQGYDAAKEIWTKIIYLAKGVVLDPESTKGAAECRMIEDGNVTKDGAAELQIETKKIEEEPSKAIKPAQEMLANKTDFINKMVNYHVSDLIYNGGDAGTLFTTLKNFVPAIAGEASVFNESFMKLSHAFIKTSFLKGYTQMVTEIENKYETDALDKWLYNYGYTKGFKLQADEKNRYELPESPLPQLQTLPDENHAEYKRGFIEGKTFGIKVKSGLATVSEKQEAKMMGEGYDKGQKDGKVQGKKAAVLALNEYNDLTQPFVEELVDDSVEFYNYMKAGGALPNDFNVNSEEGAYSKYIDGFHLSFYETYEEVTSFELGKRIGYDRWKTGGIEARNTNIPDHITIKNEEAFFNGILLGRNMSIEGKTKDEVRMVEGAEATGGPVSKEGAILAMAKKYAMFNAAADAVKEIKKDESEMNTFLEDLKATEGFDELLIANALEESPVPKPAAQIRKEQEKQKREEEKAKQKSESDGSGMGDMSGENVGDGSDGGSGMGGENVGDGSDGGSGMSGENVGDGSDGGSGMGDMSGEKVKGGSDNGSGMEAEEIEFVSAYDTGINYSYKPGEKEFIEERVKEALQSYGGLDYDASKDAALIAEYTAIFTAEYNKTYGVMKQQFLVDLMQPSMSLGIKKDLGEFDDEEEATSEENIEMIVDLLFSEDDFVIDKMGLVHQYILLESKIDTTESKIKDHLDTIDENKGHVEFLRNDEKFTEHEKEIKELEEELEKEGLTVKETNQKKTRLKHLKNKNKPKKKQIDKLEAEWAEAEKKAKDLIDSVRISMNETLGFDAPLDTNADILKYMKINLNTSKDHNEKLFVDGEPITFNTLDLKGLYTYSENSDFKVSISGQGDLNIDDHAENIDIIMGSSDILIQKQLNNDLFEFKAKGIEYVKADKEMTLLGGAIVTPKLEGGEHVGEKMTYNFDEFGLHLGQGVKNQIKTQSHKLKP